LEESLNRKSAPNYEPNLKRLYSTEETAEALSITRKHVYTIINRGEIATVNIGRRRLILADELLRYVDHVVPSSAL
jgi:excisionase family DNA binding protein